MRGISPKRYRKSADENVEEKNRDGYWEVFDHYDYDLRGRPGSRYLYAPRTRKDNVLNESWHYNPLANANSGLFLELSNWPIGQDMDKAVEAPSGLSRTLDTDKNAEAAKKWADIYGVLGLGTNSNEEHSIGSPESLSLTTARYTGAHYLGHELIRAYRNSTRGGVHETVEAFAFEAWQAHLARRLYEMASRKILDEESIIRLMDDPSTEEIMLPMLARPWHWRSEREQWSENPWSIRRWALGLVEEAVMLKVEKNCYPTLEFANEDLQGEAWPVSYKQGWGAKSLLGALWLQMMWLMVAEDNICKSCGKPFPKTRANRRYCDDDCKADWNYHKGTGKSSKSARKKKRQEQ